MIAKPGRRIFLVSSRHESRIRIEIARGPFPDVPDHLPTSEGAVTFPERPDIGTSHRSPVKVGTLRRRRIVAPGKSSLALADSASSVWFGAGGHLPLCFSWQAAFGPAAESVPRVSTHHLTVRHRTFQLIAGPHRRTKAADGQASAACK